MGIEWIIVWAGVIATAIVVEVGTNGLVSAWFAIGGMVALVLAAFEVSIEWQVVAFVVVSLGTFVGFRPLAKRYMNVPKTPTNADAALGKKFKLLADAKGGRSTVRINDVVWTVQVEGENELKAGDYVILTEISGNKYIAESFKKEEDKK